MQRSLAVRITAEGASLSLAPIWVIGVDFGLVLAPILGITTVLVFRSTRQALERSHEAHHDSLTGLVNRRSFLESLEEMLDEAHPSARPTMLVMDLDGFKDINDRLGHQLGGTHCSSPSPTGWSRARPRRRWCHGSVVAELPVPSWSMNMRNRPSTS